MQLLLLRQITTLLFSVYVLWRLQVPTSYQDFKIFLISQIMLFPLKITLSVSAEKMILAADECEKGFTMLHKDPVNASLHTVK